MSNYKYPVQELKQTPISFVLEKINHIPKFTKGNDLWYISPFRNEKTPSFKVESQLNLWHDFGEGKGGDVIKFIEVYYNLTFAEALKELAQLTNYIENTNYQVRQAYQKTEVVNQTNIKDKAVINKLQDLQNPALIEYLTERKINIDIAKKYIQEIYYQNNDKKFFAIAFENDSKGYEIRSKYFKGSLKGYAKDITSIINDNKKSNRILIFEGFIDFLSFLTISNLGLNEDVIVLNSLSFIPKIIDYINNNSQYESLHCYLDTDDAGRKAVNSLLLELDDIQVVDESNIYAKLRGDLNDSL